MKIFYHYVDKRRAFFSISLALSAKQIIVPNPFYQVYLGASLFNNLPLVFFYEYRAREENYLLDLEKLQNKIKNKTSLIYFCNPSNPQRKCASLNYLKKLINLVNKK